MDLEVQGYAASLLNIFQQLDGLMTGNALEHQACRNRVVTALGRFLMRIKIVAESESGDAAWPDLIVKWKDSLKDLEGPDEIKAAVKAVGAGIQMMANPLTDPNDPYRPAFDGVISDLQGAVDNFHNTTATRAMNYISGVGESWWYFDETFGIVRWKLLLGISVLTLSSVVFAVTRKL